MITDELIDGVAQELYRNYQEDNEWETETEMTREMWREEARTAIVTFVALANLKDQFPDMDRL